MTKARKKKPTGKPVCLACGDTHSVWSSGLERTVMCTQCPVPCKGCGRNAYCNATPCPCRCHAEKGK